MAAAAAAADSRACETRRGLWVSKQHGDAGLVGEEALQERQAVCRQRVHCAIRHLANITECHIINGNGQELRISYLHSVSTAAATTSEVSRLHMSNMSYMQLHVLVRCCQQMQ
jgi:hypothetical protein